MGQNLTRLFQYAGMDPQTEQDLDRCQAANTVLFEMFQTHGEALIAALEDAGEIIHDDYCGREHSKYCVAIAQLLSQLESEAQP